MRCDEAGQTGMAEWRVMMRSSVGADEQWTRKGADRRTGEWVCEKVNVRVCELAGKWARQGRGRHCREGQLLCESSDMSRQAGKQARKQVSKQAGLCLVILDGD